MKVVLISLALFALSSALPTQTTFGLKEDFDQFVQLLPKDQIVGIALDYLANDAEVQETFEYLQSEDFKTLIVDVEDIAEYRKFLNYLQGNGLNVYYYLNKLHEFLGLPEIVPTRSVLRRGKGVRGLIDDIKAVLPLEDIKDLYYETLEKSPAFANLINVLKGDEFKGIVQELRANPNFQKLIQRAKDHGVDIKLIIDLLNKIFGWDLEPSTRMTTFGLKEDLQDFLNLVPVSDIVGILLDYLANDEEVQGVFEYVQSEDFKDLVLEVDSLPEYIDFLNKLQGNGLDVYTLVNKLHDFLGLPSLPAPSRSGLTRRGKGVRGLLDDILAALPVEKIKALFYEKLATSPEFKNLVEFMKGDEFKSIVNKLRANPKFQEIVERAKQHGVDVNHIIELLNKIFGWGIESRRAVTFGLKEDLQDFLNLVPVSDIVGILLDYLANDEEVQGVFEYVQSEDFKDLVLEVDSLPEYIDFLNKLQGTGLDVYTVVNKLHEFLGLPTLPAPSRSGLTRRGKGVRGLLDDILAALPVEKIKALFYEKLATSPEFKNLVEFMKGDEFKSIVSKLRANPKFQEIVERARQHGVDVNHIIELLNKIFGWGIESRRAVTFGLKEDLQDFLNLVPINDIVGIMLDYLANDEEVQGVFEYVQSEDFKNLVLEVDSLPEYIDFLNKLQGTGLDVYTVVNKLHEFLGLPTLPAPSRSGLTRRGKGVRGLLDDILAALPVEKIKALFYEKLASSPEFKNLVEFMKGEEFKSIVSKLRANPKFQEIVERARQHGVDVNHIIELLNKIFGWGIESRRAVTFGLKEDLQDFMNLVPVSDIVGILLDYLANDEEVQGVFEYVQSEDFKDLVLEVDSLPEYIDFLNKLQGTGLDVYTVVNKLHEFLGLPTLPAPSRSGLTRRGKGVRGLLDDILAALPVEKIKALFYEKLATSPEFKNLVEFMKGDEFKSIVSKLRANPKFQEIVERARQHGVDVNHIIELLNKIFGWGIEY